MKDEIQSNSTNRLTTDRDLTELASDGITFSELFDLLWKGKLIILAMTGIFAAGSVFYSLTLESIYRMETTLAPAAARTSGSPLAGQLGGAAALIGIDLGSMTGDDRVPNVLAVMQSRRFITNFVKDNNYVVPLFAGYWDSETGTSRIDPTIFNSESGEWVQDSGMPTDLDIYRSFSSILSINRDRATGLINVAINWKDPVIGTEWVNKLVQDINKQIKDADQAEANSAISFLRSQLQSTQLVEMQRVFYDLIESQTRVTMLADVREEYIFQVIDPAVVPDERVYPRRSVIAVVGTFSGVVLSILLLLGMHVLQMRRAGRS